MIGKTQLAEFFFKIFFYHLFGTGNENYLDVSGPNFNGQWFNRLDADFFLGARSAYGEHYGQGMIWFFRHFPQSFSCEYLIFLAIFFLGIQIQQS